MSRGDGPDAQAFDWLTLDAEEELIWSARPRLLGHAWSFAIGLLLAPVGIGLLIIAGTYLTARNTAFVITSDRVYKKTGVLSRNVTDIGHGKIQDTGYRQGFVGTQLGFGTVEISTAGGSDVELRFSAVPDPLDVQSILDEVARTAPGDADRSDGQPAEAHSAASGLDGAALSELVDELRGTREALESIERRLNEDGGAGRDEGAGAGRSEDAEAGQTEDTGAGRNEDAGTGRNED